MPSFGRARVDPNRAFKAGRPLHRTSTEHPRQERGLAITTWIERPATSSDGKDGFENSRPSHMNNHRTALIALRPANKGRAVPFQLI